MEMNACKPFGDVEKANILVIGHDPKLQKSNAQAQYAFFLDYLQRPPPMLPSERRKYDFASSVVSYIKYLAGSNLSLEDMLFTNLCSEFLERPIGGGTVLITDDAAYRGIQAIESILQRGSFKLILPMAPQVFYHLVRAGFVSGVILGFVFFTDCFGGAIGTVVAGRIFDVTGSYQLAFLICAVFSAVCIIFATLLRPVSGAEGRNESRKSP